MHVGVFIGVRSGLGFRQKKLGEDKQSQINQNQPSNIRNTKQKFDAMKIYKGLLLRWLCGVWCGGCSVCGVVVCGTTVNRLFQLTRLAINLFGNQ